MIRKTSVVIAVLALLLLLGKDALAFGKTTIDPNTLPREEQKDFWDSDARLAQKVTLDARRKTVLSIMDDLTKMTGVTLNSGYNSKDWQVRDRKMLIVVKDMPLKDLMQSIARTMKFKWSRSQSELYTYRIFMDRKTLLDAEGQAYRAEKKYEELLEKRREVLANKMADVANIGPEDIDSIKETDPYMYILAKTGFAGPMAQLLQQVPAAREAFLNRSEAQISGKQLSEEMQPVAAQLAQAIDKLTSNDKSDQFRSDDDKPIDVLNIEFNINDQNPDDPLMRRFYLGLVALQWKQGNTTRSTDFPLMDPESSIGKTSGLQYQMRMEMAPGDPEPKPMPTIVDPEEIRQSDFGEPVAAHTAEDIAALFPMRVTSDGNPSKVVYTAAEEWFLAIVERTGMNVVSDYLGKSISARIGGSSNWWRHGNTIEFRDRYWFKKRSLQITESYIEPWRKHFKEKGTLDIDDLAEIAALTGNREQYEVNINGDEVLGNESMRQAIISPRQLRPLRFYYSLSKEQRTALLTDEGLSQESLTSKQKENILSIAPYISYCTSPLKMTVASSPGRNEYRVSTSNGSQVFSIWTPKYEPAKKETSVKSSNN